MPLRGSSRLLEIATSDVYSSLVFSLSPRGDQNRITFGIMPAKCQRTCRLEVENETTELVMAFSYLGIEVMSNLYKETIKQTKKAAQFRSTEINK